METNTEKKGFEVAVKFQVSFADVAGLLASAWTGSAYWATVNKYIAPTAWLFESEPRAEEGKHYPNDYPLNPGGCVLIEDMEEEGKVYELDQAAIARGLALMAEKYPEHWADFVKEDYDSTAGDVFLQLSLLGDVIYG